MAEWTLAVPHVDVLMPLILRASASRGCNGTDPMQRGVVATILLAGNFCSVL
jgi:hypothetical protein